MGGRAAQGTWILAALGIVLAAGCTRNLPDENAALVLSLTNTPGTQLASLDELSILALRSRSYSSHPRVEKRLSAGKTGAAYSRHFASDGSQAYESYLLSYHSDQLRIYARLDIPSTPKPEDGFPVIVFLHGWVGEDAAPTSNFFYAPDAYYGPSIDSYVDAGFVVISPGFRGHGTVNGVAADGIEYLQAWDNGTYLSPLFYAIDVLNLLEGLPKLAAEQSLELDPNRIFLAGHSQGGDVALTVLAVAGEGSKLKTKIAGGSIWAGTFAPRLVQLATFYPMQTTAAAFVSGDGSWNGTPVGRDGSFNLDFVFSHPAPWITQPSPEAWTWQHESWQLESVEEALLVKLTEMYTAINLGVADIEAAKFSISKSPAGRTTVEHDAQVTAAMPRLDAFGHPQFLTEPLVLHHSDQDFYSLPQWNKTLCDRVQRAGGHCTQYNYLQNTHLLGVSEHRWFSDEDAEPGFAQAMQRDIAFFGPSQAVEHP